MVNINHAFLIICLIVNPSWKTAMSGNSSYVKKSISVSFDCFSVSYRFFRFGMVP